MVSVSINATLIYQLLAFLILMFVLNKILYKPILGIINERERKFQSLKDGAADSKKLLEQGEAEEKESGIEVRRQGSKSFNVLKAEGQAREKEIHEKAQQEAAKSLELAMESIRSDVQAAKEDLDKEASKIGGEIASRLLGREVAA
jgi:F-type H+-transporting ATPase subunit b